VTEAGADDVSEISLGSGTAIYLAFLIPAIAGLAVAVTLGSLHEPRIEVGLIRIVLVVVPLIAIVVMGVGLLSCWALGIPIVRIDDRGLVFGRDRRRDPAIDWRDIQRVDVRSLRYRSMHYRVFAIRAAPGARATKGRGLWARLTGKLSSMFYGSPYAISSLGVDWSEDQIREMLQSHLPGMPIVDEPRR
jgi:hypothetical protein